LQVINSIKKLPRKSRGGASEQEGEGPKKEGPWWVPISQVTVVVGPLQLRPISRGWRRPVTTPRHFHVSLSI